MEVLLYSPYVLSWEGQGKLNLFMPPTNIDPDAKYYY
jgi:hypothetical protein